MTAAWAGVACSQPPCLSVSIRRTRHSHAQHPGAAGLHREPGLAGPGAPGGLPRHRLGRRRGQVRRRRPHPGAGRARWTPPASAEFPIVLECRLLHATDLGVHTQFVGEVLEVQADEAVLGPGGLPDITLLRPLLYAPGQTAYYGVGPRLAPAFSVGKGLGRRPEPPPVYGVTMIVPSIPGWMEQT